MLKTGLIAAAVLAASQSAWAQQPPAAGGQLQQIPPVTTPDKPAPDLHIERSEAASDEPAAGAVIRVQSLRVTGAKLFSEAELVAATGFAPGSEMTLPELRNAAAAISRFYNSRGYILAQAYLPAQDIVNGAVTIAVVEGEYGAIGLRNTTNLSDGVARRAMRGLRSGDPVAIAPLERSLLLLSDIPGVTVRSTLAPGTAVGSSDLTVDLAPGRRVTGSLEADNAGNRYTGAYRLGGAININNPTGLGDLVSLRLLASNESLVYGRVAYQAPVGDAVLGVSYAHMRYELGRDFAALDASGTADIVSLFGSYPLVRSRNANLYLVANLDLKRLEDEIGLASQVSNKTSQALSVGFRGDSHDTFGGGGWNAYSAGWTAGDLDIESPVERAADALAGRTQGSFGKLQFSLARLQTVKGPLSVYGAVRGQLASGNLDSSEQMELGGAYGVRAYPEGDAYGDQGYVATLEARLDLDRWTGRLPGRFRLIGFVDAGEVDFAHDPWFTGPNHARRSGIGAGLAWTAPGDLLVRASYARKLGDAVAASEPDERGRVWVQIAKLF